MMQVANKKGFTLIEILIVLTLIGILSAFMFAGFGSLKKARDTKRKADLKQIEKALEQHRSDNGYYPSNVVTGTPNLLNCPSTPPETFFGNAIVTPPPSSCTTVYLNKIPADPNGTSYWNSGNYFYYSSDGEKYYLAACAEDTTDKDALEEAALGDKIENAFNPSAKTALLNTAAFANDCASNYGYLIISQ